MITLITGVPGSSKTLNTLEMVDTEWGDSGRPIFYRGIRDLTLDWKELDDDKFLTWWEYPEGSIFVIDEVQQIWPGRPNNKPEPISVTKMDTHRHGGYDFFLITQKTTKVDHGVRAFVGRHLHYERPFGHETSRCLEWQKCVDKVDDYHCREEALITRKKFNKKYFDVYKSAEVHTHKKRIPKKLYAIAALIFSCFGLAAYAYSSISGRSDRMQEFNQDNIDPISTLEQYQGVFPERSNLDDDVVTTAEYLELHTPRIEFMPHSAPMFDGVTEVKTFPRPQCIYRHKNEACHCYTQQATPLDIPYSICRDIVSHGWFNPYHDEEGARAEALAARAAWTPEPTIEEPKTLELHFKKTDF